MTTVYEKMLKMGKDALEAVKIPFEARKAEMDLNKEIITLEQKIAESDLNISDAKSTRPLNLRNILDAMDKKALAERDLEMANELKIELFSEAKD